MEPTVWEVFWVGVLSDLSTAGSVP